MRYGSCVTESEEYNLVIFYSFTPVLLNAWRRKQVNLRFSNDLSHAPIVDSSSSYPPVPAISSPAPASSSFRSSIKMKISDYSKLRDETQWRTFDRQLRATAASHYTSTDTLTPSYVPTQDAQAIFRDKQRFLYSVFPNILPTT